jgi:hypothetical protein
MRRDVHRQKDRIYIKKDNERLAGGKKMSYSKNNRNLERKCAEEKGEVIW